MPKESAKAEVEEKSIVHIDPDNLDYEWFEHAERVEAAGLRLAKAEEARDRAKATLELVEAEVSLAVQADPKRKDKRVDTVKALVIVSREYATAKEEFMQLESRVRKRKVVVNALTHRKTALENAVKLWLASYNAEPKVTSATKEEIDAARKRLAREGLGKRTRETEHADDKEEDE